MNGVHMGSRTLAVFFSLSVLAPGCGGADAGGHDDHGHGDGGHGDHGDHGDHGGGGGHGDAEGPSLAFSRWTGTHELFVEFDAPAIGQRMGYHAHVTRLADNHAATEGTLTIRFFSDETLVTNHEDHHVARPGIFSSTAKVPADPGEYDVEFRYQHGEENARWSVGTVQVGETPVEGAPQPEGEIAFLKETQWQIPFLTELPVEMAVASPLTVPASVVPDPLLTAVTAAPASGQVLWGSDGRVPVVGQRVRQGEMLGHVVPGASSEHVSQLRADAERARVDQERAAVEQERISGLVDQGLLPEKRRVEAQADLDKAQAQLDATQSRSSQLLGGRTSAVPLRAPRDGVITALHRTHGSDVEAGKVLVEVADDAAVLIRGHLFQLDLADLADVRWATLQRGDWPVPLPVEDLGGELLTDQAVIDPETLAAPVAYRVRNDRQLRFGDLVELTLGTGDGEPGLTVPREAVVEINTRPYLFVMIGGESFSRRPVELGSADADRVLIQSGLEPNDRVVSRGGFDVYVASLGGALESHRH
jgi:membrane fusion protein, heavy metal efflux system